MASKNLLTIIIILALLLSFSSIAMYGVKASRDYPPPSLKIQLTSPTNKTYTQNSILINFSIQKEPDDWNHYLIEYAIEGENKNYSGTFLWMQQLTGISEKNFSKTITGIPDGTYVLTITARWDALLIWSHADKKTVTFTIDTKIPTPTPTITPTPTPTPDNQQTLNTEATIGIAITVAVLGAGICFCIYLLKKH